MLAGLIVAYAILLLPYVLLANLDVLTLAHMIFRMRMKDVFYEYQQIGDSFALSALALMGVWQLRSHRVSRRSILQAIGFATLSIALLFTNPSRSAAFLGSTCLLLALVLRTSGRWRIGLIAGLLVGAAVLVMQPASELTGGSRFVSLFDGEAKDKSVEGHRGILEQGWKAISEHPLTGDWALELERMRRSGLYIHNALNIWVQAGIVPFIAFLVVWALAIDNFLSRWRSSPRCYGVTLPPVAFALLSWATSRHAAYTLPFVGLGFFAATVARVELQDRRTRADSGGWSYRDPIRRVGRLHPPSGRAPASFRWGAKPADHRQPINNIQDRKRYGP